MFEKTLKELQRCMVIYGLRIKIPYTLNYTAFQLQTTHKNKANIQGLASITKDQLSNALDVLGHLNSK